MNVARIQPTEIARFLQGAAGRRLVVLVNVLLVVWIAARLAALTWNLLPQTDVGTAPAAGANPALPAARPDPDRELISQIQNWHLLGVPAREPAQVTATVPQDAPDTQLRLTLSGALASDDRRMARAIIADQGGREDQYAIGDSLPGNAELSEIYTDRVILKRNGRYETLRLPEESRSGGSLPAMTLRTPPATSPAQRLRTLREQLKNRPSTLGRFLRANQKVDESGNIIGFEVHPGSNPDLFEQVGLQEGDIIVQVNDIDVSDPANGGRALQSLQNDDRVTVKLLRDGQEQNLDLDASR